MKGVIKVILMCFLSILSLNINAATINGSFGITGDWTQTGTSLLDASAISLNSPVSGVDGSTDNTSNVDFFSKGAGGSTESLTAALTGTNFFTIEGWDFELTTLSIVDQSSTLLSLSGSGILSGTGFDATNATWVFSATSLNNYNMGVTAAGIAAVPVPAAIWLFGSGLIGLIGVARRKA